MAEIAVRTDKLTMEFAAVRAVDALDIEVSAGTVFGFLGPNGAGKTTTIRLLLGLLTPTAGSAQVLGYDTRTQADRIRSRTGVLLEHTGLYARLSAIDNLDFYGRIWHIPSKERHDRTHDLLTHLGLWDRAREPVESWSRGMQQKLAVARALFHRPELVFLDEPTASLDPVAAASLRRDLAGLARREGVTIFLTTHNLAEAEELCDRLGLIRQGRLVAMGTPTELSARRNTPQLVVTGRGFSADVLALVRARAEVISAETADNTLILSLSDHADTAPVVALLVESGADIEEIHRHRASLDEVYVDLMTEGP